MIHFYQCHQSSLRFFRFYFDCFCGFSLLTVFLVMVCNSFAYGCFLVCISYKNILFTVSAPFFPAISHHIYLANKSNRELNIFSWWCRVMSRQNVFLCKHISNLSRREIFAIYHVKSGTCLAWFSNERKLLFPNYIRATFMKKEIEKEIFEFSLLLKFVLQHFMYLIWKNQIFFLTLCVLR